MSYLDYLPDYEDSFETELNESEQSAFDLSALQDSLMSIPPTPKLGVPIFPNPLEGFFKAEPTAEDTDIYEEMPAILDPNDRKQLKNVDAVIRYNTLKRDRTNIYSSATKMMNPEGDGQPPAGGLGSLAETGLTCPEQLECHYSRTEQDQRQHFSS